MSRERLPDERDSVTRKVEISSSEFGRVDLYIIVGMFADGRPGELFTRIGREGTTLAALLDQWAIAVSIGLQSGTHLSMFVSKFSHCRFEPCGLTSDSELPLCSSPIDYTMRWMAVRFAEHLDGAE